MEKKPLKKQIASATAQVMIVGFVAAIATVVAIRFTGFYLADKVDSAGRKLLKKK